MLLTERKLRQIIRKVILERSRVSKEEAAKMVKNRDGDWVSPLKDGYENLKKEMSSQDPFEENYNATLKIAQLAIKWCNQNKDKYDHPHDAMDDLLDQQSDAMFKASGGYAAPGAVLLDLWYHAGY